MRITNDIKTNSFNNNDTDLDKNRNNSINEFDFLINSIWSNVVGSLDLNLSIIFSPADADLFHQNFNTSFEFLNRFESKCVQFDREIKKRLCNSASYKYFVKKWQIQVYYQIRFQEIVSKFEEDLLSYTKLYNLQNEFGNEDLHLIDLNPNIFYLVVSDTLVKQMEFCWNESKCFLKCLMSQFWKLNLQLLSRYCSFFTQLFQNKIQMIQNSDQSQNQLSPLDQQQRPKTPTEVQTSIHSNNEQSNLQSNDINFTLLLLNDVNKLWSLKLPNFFDGIISPIMRSSNAIKDLSLIKEGFSCSLTSFNELQINLIDYIVKSQSEKCIFHLKNANDIPRLFRRTNREVCSVFLITITLFLIFLSILF